MKVSYINKLDVVTVRPDERTIFLAVKGVSVEHITDLHRSLMTAITDFCEYSSEEDDIGSIRIVNRDDLTPEQLRNLLGL